MCMHTWAVWIFSLVVSFIFIKAFVSFDGLII